MVADRHINDTPSLQFLREQVLRIDDRVARIAGGGAHLRELGRGFAGDGEDFSAHGGDARGEGLQGLEVGLAEGAPGAAVDFWKGGLVYILGKEQLLESGGELDVQTTKMNSLEARRASYCSIGFVILRER